MPTKTIGSCSQCNYPIAASYVGETVSCPMCNTLNEAITGVDVPNVIFWGGLGFVAGYLVAKSKTIGTKLARL